MGGVDNGLTLEGLAQRLEALEHENARLRDEVAAFKGSDTGRDGVGSVPRTPSAPRAENGAEGGRDQATEFLEGRMNRRRLLKGAAAAAAGLVVAGSLTQRDIREAKAEQLIGSTDNANGGAVEGFNANNNSGYGVYGEGSRAGVLGEVSFGRGTGVVGRNRNYVGGFGVEGETTGHGGVGVFGSNDSGGSYDEPRGIGVWGRSNSYGVQGDSHFHTGVVGNGGLEYLTGSGNIAGGDGVVGTGTGTGVGVLGRNTNSGHGLDSGDTVGVKGEGNGVGVQGESQNIGVRAVGHIGVSGEGSPDSSVTHIAVRGLSPNGIGGVFGGGRTQLKLNPNATTGRPTTGAHQTGELFMNSTCELFICSRSGVPGTWRKVQTVPA